jgi:hypothetical protein
MGSVRLGKLSNVMVLLKCPLVLEIMNKAPKGLPPSIKLEGHYLTFYNIGVIVTQTVNP